MCHCLKPLQSTSCDQERKKDVGVEVSQQEEVHGVGLGRRGGGGAAAAAETQNQVEVWVAH